MNLLLTKAQLDELNYVYQRIGFQCFSDTLFEEAGAAFFQGSLDPRLLISYYADLKGNLFTSSDSLNVYAGVAEHMPPDASVDDLSALHLPRPRAGSPDFALSELINSYCESS